MQDHYTYCRISLIPRLSHMRLKIRRRGVSLEYFKHEKHHKRELNCVWANKAVSCENVKMWSECIEMVDNSVVVAFAHD